MTSPANAPAWQPMSANPFPWDHADVIVMAFHKTDREIYQTFRCVCAEHGAYFAKDGGWTSIIEDGWIPYAWRDDDSPAPDDMKFPPVWSDYLTKDDEP